MCLRLCCTTRSSRPIRKQKPRGTASAGGGEHCRTRCRCFHLASHCLYPLGATVLVAPNSHHPRTSDDTGYLSLIFASSIPVRFLSFFAPKLAELAAFAPLQISYFISGFGRMWNNNGYPGYGGGYGPPQGAPPPPAPGYGTPP